MSEQVTRIPTASVHDYERAAGERAQGRFGPHSVLAQGESAARMSGERAAEFERRLTSLIGEFFGAEAAQWSEPVKYGFRWYLAPVALAPEDDDRVDPSLRGQG